MAAGKQKQMLDVGARAPEFQLSGLDTHRRGLRELLASGPVLLAFFKSSCPVCQFTFPYLERIHRGAANGSFSVYGVSQDDAEATRDFNEEYGITFPVLLDTVETNYPASNAYGISHVPTAYLVEPDGAISWTMEGFDKKALESLGTKAAVKVFRKDERVPDFRAG
jgi:peroxiredoxin